MNKLIWLFAILGMVSFGSSLRAGSLYLANFDVTNVCKEHLDKQDITSFEMWDDDPSDPMLVNRNPETPVEITNIWFAPSVYGWLIEANKQKVVHCHKETISFVNFSVAENRQRYFMFVQDAFDVTEVHLHSFVSCGSPCHFARVESIIFFDDARESAVYDHIEDTLPNEYLSKWFRADLKDDERKLFEKSVAEK
ncbi:hypothetical protein N9N21_06990 [Alphaproteobacteria bacterium]|nr:hypothetical protein [Alphaproteobacteria bacterium]